MKGLMSVQDIFGTASVFAAYFGAEDYIHDLGGFGPMGTTKCFCKDPDRNK